MLDCFGSREGDRSSMKKIIATTETGRGVRYSVDCRTKHEVPRQEWGAFSQQFSRDHREWLVDVARSGEGSKSSREAHGLPFEALTFHLDHTQEVFSIIARKNGIPQGHAYQSVRRPCRVIIERTESEVILHIDSAGGALTIIRFHRVATPDYDSAA
jgi:hypothetical protein